MYSDCKEVIFLVAAHDVERLGLSLFHHGESVDDVHDSLNYDSLKSIALLFNKRKCLTIVTKNTKKYYICLVFPRSLLLGPHVSSAWK